MYQSSAHKELKQTVKQFSDEDMIWVLHVMNKDHEEHYLGRNIDDMDSALVRLDIKTLNTMTNMDEIRIKVINSYEEIKEGSINHFIGTLKDFQSTLKIRGRDLSKYKSNKRLLYFVLNQINHKEGQYNTFRDIQNEYFRFLYTIFMLPNYYDTNRTLDDLEASFSKIISKKPLHFKSFDSDEFYLWAKTYMDQDRENAKVLNSTSYTPLSPKEYSIVVNAIFDNLLAIDNNIYRALKDKLSNAAYQKNYRKKNKGRKHHYYLTDKAHRCLEILSEKHNITEEKMIEDLINERYTKECMDMNGNHLYTLTC
ncbi:hypothetical protein OW666_16200 [Acinetobacter baumannii]|uniref:hypothetical protein n=1 Tax=Acinetobacter baumannii TaxID=470 RepID=UPI002340E50F|nr:hypothetical protein [Acinetobacter baumannii]MDC4584464.1 hypothetical protein [Acinetobacter baumannii]MDK2130414.1 hypothetical protein [Acinetobacter baumannii]MDK2161131.1 hypothetical protein [Acinetobacter baumannii]MDK2168568.1 hypothetical protein [Acinetobacter baumannii]MDK2252145.1 hypothetical protein [Acinetobacter baumannii]